MHMAKNYEERLLCNEFQFHWQAIIISMIFLHKGLLGLLLASLGKWGMRIILIHLKHRTAS